MNIDLQKAINEFIKYTEKYDISNIHIKGKQKHSLRVMRIAQQIAEGLKLSKENIELAMLIGLLHDIARFEQYTIYGTFKDIESIDHGDLGAKILEKDIRNYIETDKYDEMIIKAVKNHNKFKIEEGLTTEEILFSRIVRDADKIDIFYESVEMFWKGKEQEVEKSIISEEAIQQIKKFSQTKRKKAESPIDNIIRVIGFIFDLNFKSSFRILKQENYINKILDRYNLKDKYTKEKVQEIREIANKYIENKI